MCQGDKLNFLWIKTEFAVGMPCYWINACNVQPPRLPLWPLLSSFSISSRSYHQKAIFGSTSSNEANLSTLRPISSTRSHLESFVQWKITGRERESVEISPMYQISFAKGIDLLQLHIPQSNVSRSLIIS